MTRLVSPMPWQKQDDAKVAQYAIMNTPATSYRSTIALEKAIQYMGVARGLFDVARDHRALALGFAPY